MARKKDEKPIQAVAGANKPAETPTASPMIGKTFAAAGGPGTMDVQQAQQVKLTPEEEARRAKLKQVDEALARFRLYPVAANEQSKNEALAIIRKLYKEGDDNIKQVILFTMHETLSQFSEFRSVRNLDYFKKKFPQNDPVQNRMGVYRSMFNYTASLEGMVEVLGLVASFGDDESAKLLTHQFSFFCSYDGSEAARMMRNAAADALGKSDSIYALKALIAYAKDVESEQLANRLIASISKWREKLVHMKMDQKQKDEFLAQINEFSMAESGERHYR